MTRDAPIRSLLAKFLGTGLLVATVVGSGIMAQKLRWRRAPKAGSDASQIVSA